MIFMCLLVLCGGFAGSLSRFARLCGEFVKICQALPGFTRLCQTLSDFVRDCAEVGRSGN